MAHPSPSPESFQITSLDAMGSIDSGLLLAKHMEEDDLQFASRLSDTRRLLAMFTLESNPVISRPALVLLSDLRLYIAPKKTLLGRYVKFNIALNDIVEVAVIQRRSGHYASIISFLEGADQLKRATLVAQDLLQKEFVQLLINTGLLLNLGRAQRDRMRWHLPDLFVGFPTETPTWRSALVLQYRAFCDALRISPAPSVLTAFLNEPVDVFNPLKLLETSKPLIPDLRALCLAARNCTFFESVEVEHGFALNDEAIECIALVLGLHNCITSIRISEAKFGRHGLEALAQAFDSHEGPVSLTELKLYRAHMSLTSVRRLCSSLPPLTKLDLASCALSAASVAYLCSHLSPNSLQYLNLSNSACARSGSMALSKFVSKSTALNLLIMIGANLDTKLLLNAILDNPEMPLQALNMSQNRIPKSACLCLSEFLFKSGFLQELILSHVKAVPADLGILLSAAINVQMRAPLHNVLKLDLSGCDIGSYPVFVLVPKRVKVVHSRLNVLDLSDCKLGYPGLANVLSVAVQVQSLETLIVSSNSRATIFNKGIVELRDVLAQVARASSIRRLMMDECEGGRGLPSGVFAPMFEALALSQSLKWLSVAGHRLNEPTLLILTWSLKTNRSLVHLDIDRNHSSFRSLTTLSDAIRYNDTLCCVHVENDLARLQRHTAKTAESIADTIRARMQLNRRRRVGEIDSADNPVAYLSKDARFQNYGSRALSDDDVGSVTSSCPQFGMDIEAYDLVPCPDQMRSSLGYGPGIPKVLLALQSMIVVDHGMAMEGIFRIASDADLQAEVKKALDDGKDASGLNPTAACAANLIKIWFRQLPIRILTPAIPIFAERVARGVTLHEALNPLSPRAQSVLLWLLDVCTAVASMTESNKMTPRSLAIVFAPNLFDDGASTQDPMDSLRRSQHVALCMESWILERVMEGHPLPEALGSDPPGSHLTQAAQDVVGEEALASDSYVVHRSFFSLPATPAEKRLHLPQHLADGIATFR